jgi:hypothetical protein
MSKQFSITQVPQADELSKVILTVEAIFNDSRSDEQIAEYVGFTDRQGRYYRSAAELLGLIENTNNTAKLTQLGINLIVLEDDNRTIKIRGILLRNDFFSEVLGYIERESGSNKIGISRNELYEYLLTIVDGAESTIQRRINSIINWLLFTQLIRTDVRKIDEKENETVYVNNELIDDNEELEIINTYDQTNYKSDSIYPTSYTTEELDIKETHMQVISFLRKKQQKKILVPEFQRNQVWKQQQKSRFIESLILNIPVPPFYISQDYDGNMIIVDGLQRSNAIFEFLNNKYELVGLDALPNLVGKDYSHLDEDLKARIEDRELLLYILKPTVPMTIVYDIFNRINSNGSPLTRQEIRNCIYIGKSTSFLFELSINPIFKTAIDHGIPSLRMKDREAILRFFSFLLFDYKIDYKGDLDDFLGKTMKKINRLTDVEIFDLKKRFLRVMSMSFDFFKDKNFRLPTPYSRGRINIALLESVSAFFDKNSDDFLKTNKKRIVENYFKILLIDPEFIESVRFSTNSERNVKIRFNKANEILSQIN